MVTTNLINVDAKKPMIEPIAALKARFKLFLSNSNSPINAPTKGPIKKPKGIGVINPTTNPILVPQTPYLLPPNFLVPCAGIT